MNAKTVKLAAGSHAPGEVAYGIPVETDERVPEGKILSPDQPIPDEAIEAGRAAMNYMYPGKIDGILVEEILREALPHLEAAIRAKIRERVEDVDAPIIHEGAAFQAAITAALTAIDEADG